MRTNLAYIEQAATAAITKPHIQHRTAVIGGFRVEEEPRESPKWVEQRKSYRRSSELLRENLTHAGITPLAILPKAWWREMVAAKGLYDMLPDGEGRVPVSVAAEAEAAEGARYGIMLMLAVSLVVGTIGLTMLPTFAHTWLYVPYYAVTMLATFIFMAVTHNERGDNGMARLTSRACAWMHVMASGGNQKAMLRMLRRDAQETTRVMIRLPEPPADVAETLRKALRLSYRVNVAVEPGAVAFAKSPSLLIAHRMRKNSADRAHEAALERARLAALDPIIYVEEGSAVAIIAQFGDFPLEQELVDRVVAQQGSIA